MQRPVASAARRARQRMRAITPSAAATVAHAKRRCMTPISIVFSRRVALSKSAASAGARCIGPSTAAPPHGCAIWRPGAEDWAPAKVNTPLAAGDSLYTGDGANLELQVGPSAFVRAGAGTELGLESLESDLQQFKLTTGHAAVDARRLPQGQAIEVDTPNGAFTIDRPGYYRIDVEQDRTTFTTRRGGEAPP